MIRFMINEFDKVFWCSAGFVGNIQILFLHFWITLWQSNCSLVDPTMTIGTPVLTLYTISLEANNFSSFRSKRQFRNWFLSSLIIFLILDSLTETWLTVTMWWLRRPRWPWWPRQSTPWRPRQLTSWWRRRQQWKPWRLQINWTPWCMTRKQQKYLIISYLFL